jgi:transcriptional regulator with XRE-family HTH domain
MKLRENFTQEVAASKSSISVSTAGRIEGNRHQPKKDNRGWLYRDYLNDHIQGLTGSLRK